MRLLVFGRRGQLARELARAMPQAICMGRTATDLSRPGAASAAIAASRPEAVINAAAWTDVDAAEQHPNASFALNAAAPSEMARVCAARGVPFLHVSTDQVFSGTGDMPWRPEDTPAPLNLYGRSKLTGEHGVRAAGGVSVILRTSWVFSGRGRDFVTAILAAADQQPRLRVVADQIGGPTPASDLAAACLRILHTLRNAPDCAGTYHFAGQPEVSRAGFAAAILAEAGRTTRIAPVPSARYPSPARRPLNARLDSTMTEAVFGLAPPDWAAALPEAVRRQALAA